MRAAITSSHMATGNAVIAEKDVTVTAGQRTEVTLP